MHRLHDEPTLYVLKSCLYCPLMPVADVKPIWSELSVALHGILTFVEYEEIGLSVNSRFLQLLGSPLELAAVPTEVVK